jgi:hypothetical protein
MMSPFLQIGNRYVTIVSVKSSHDSVSKYKLTRQSSYFSIICEKRSKQYDI